MSRFAVLVVVLLASLATGEQRCAGADKEEAKKIAKDLKHKDVKVRLKAAEQLGALGKGAAPVAKELCDAILDPDAKVSLAAFKAIEAARPDLYKPLSKMLLDADVDVRIAGVQGLGELKAAAEPTAYLLTQYIVLESNKVKRGYTDPERLELTVFRSLKQIGSEDTEIIKAFKILAGPMTMSVRRRDEAMKVLISWAGVDNNRRKELLPLIKSALETPGLLKPAAELAEEYADLCKDFLPVLKQLKLSKEIDLREAATKAVEAIEAK